MTPLESLLLEQEAPVAVLKRIPVHLDTELKTKFSQDEIIEYNKKGYIDPPPVLPYWKDIRHQLHRQKAVFALIDSSLCWVDRSYDRNVNWANLVLWILKKNGFSYNAAQIIDVVYDRRANRFYVVIGQHRVDMSLLCIGPNALIAARIILLDETLSEPEQIKIESDKHHTEANNITDQKPQEKLLSGFTSGDAEALAYCNFITAHGIGVIGQEHLHPDIKFSKTCKAPWAVQRAIDTGGKKGEATAKDECSFALELIRDYMDCKEIDGRLIQSVTQYLFYFKNRLSAVAKVLGLSYEEFVRKFFKNAFDFKEKNGMLIMTSELLKDLGEFRGEMTVIPVARLIKITNYYVRRRKVDLKKIDGRKKSEKGNRWLSAEEDLFQNYLKACKVGEVLKQIPVGIINAI